MKMVPQIEVGDIMVWKDGKLSTVTELYPDIRFVRVVDDEGRFYKIPVEVLEWKDDLQQWVSK